MASYRCEVGARCARVGVGSTVRWAARGGGVGAGTGHSLLLAEGAVWLSPDPFRRFGEGSI